MSVANAIITIVPVELGDKPGFSGSLGGSFETKRGNTEKEEYNAGLKLRYDNNESYTIWSDFIGSYGKASGVENTNKTYAHIRFVHSLYENNLDGELFVQSETNEFTSIDKRRLVGGGLRYRFAHGDFGKFFFGLGGYYETVNYTTDFDPYEQSIRINSYLAYTKKFENKSSISYVGYYQPKTEDFSDYIVSNSVEVKVNIYLELYLSFLVYYDVDSNPAIGREKEDITQKTSFIYEF